MTRTIFLIAALLLVALIALVIVGLTQTQPALLALPILCMFPLFALLMGIGIGRVWKMTETYELVPRKTAAPNMNGREQQPKRERQPLG